MKKIIIITIEKLLEMKVNNEKFKLIEVLSEESYNEGHIPGEVNIPLSEIGSLVTKYPRVLLTMFSFSFVVLGLRVL